MSERGMEYGSWPEGYRHAMHQDQHESWNASHYPGTRQLCCECGDPTGRCEDDSIYEGDEGPFCEECGKEYRRQLLCSNGLKQGVAGDSGVCVECGEICSDDDGWYQTVNTTGGICRCQECALHCVNRST